MIKPLKSARFVTPMVKNAKTLSALLANNDAAQLNDPPLVRHEIQDCDRLRADCDSRVFDSRFSFRGAYR
jgi:hypothetical protein